MKLTTVRLPQCINLRAHLSTYIYLLYIYYYCRVVFADSTRADVSMFNPNAEKEQPKQFTFDSTYGPDCTQKQIYDITASPIVDSVLHGFNGTIFAVSYYLLRF